MIRCSLIILISCFIFASCVQVKPVVFIRAQEFHVESVNGNPQVKFQLVFNNPNSFGCTISGLQSDGHLNERMIFNADIQSKVKARRKNNFIIPVTANMARMNLEELLGTGINLILNNEAVPMKIAGSLKIRKFIVTKTVRFDYKQNLDKTDLKKLF